MTEAIGDLVSSLGLRDGMKTGMALGQKGCDEEVEISLRELFWHVNVFELGFL